MKDTINNIKYKQINLKNQLGRKYLQNIQLLKERQTNHPVKKGQRVQVVNPQKEIQTANEHLKRYSVSRVVRKVQVKRKCDTVSANLAKMERIASL